MANQPAEGTQGLTDAQIQTLAVAAGVPEAASKDGVMYTPTIGFNGEIEDPTNPASVQWTQEGALRQAITERFDD